MGMHWRHVRTHENPADLVSCGVSPSELVGNNLWWHGPDWLRTTQENWPLNRMDIEANNLPKNIDLEHRRTAQVNVCVTQNDTITEFSTYNRLIRITSLSRRFIFNCRHPSNRFTGRLTGEELQSTRRLWILQAQRQCYYDEILCLKKSVPAPLDNKSKLLSLTPIIDGNGLLRVRGRLENSMLPYDEMHPIILPPNAYFTGLLIDRFHERTMHGGTSLVASMIRRQYWIVNARDAIRHRIKKCDVCFRHRAVMQKQLMGSLPSARVRRTTRAFLHTGIDYCGPFDIRASKGRGIRSYKGYVAVFICLTVKAIHLECVDGLTSAAFLAAFHRFVARRGLPSDMYSDNGTNFVGAANEMERQFYSAKREIENQLADKFIEENVKWHFIPPASPHFGGLWEAGVKSTKHHLRRVIGESKLTYEEMSTLLCQIEACLNSRPLCENSNDPTDITALTPGHFLINSALLSIPEPSIVDINPNRLDRWQQIQQMRQFFWKRWQSDYLSLLQQRPKWCASKPNLKIGELVLVQDDRCPSSRWPLGRIIDTHPGADGCIRVVTVRTAYGIYKRNITRISRLPINDDIDEETHGETAPATNEDTENQPNNSICDTSI